MNLFARIYTTIHRRVWIMSKDLPQADASLPPSEFHMRVLDRSLLASYAAFRPDQREEAVKRLEQGHRAILVCEGDRIVGSIWATAGRAYIPYIDRDIVLRPKEVYAYDAFTHPEYRRRGVSRTRNIFLTTECRRMGYTKVAAIVAFENNTGLLSSEAAGYRRIGVFACVRLGSAQIDVVRSATEFGLPRFVKPLKRRAG